MFAPIALLTLACITPGLLGDGTQPQVDAEDAAVAGITRLGGRVKFIHDDETMPVIGVYLDSVRDPSAALKFAKVFTRLEVLQVSQSQMSPSAVKELCGLHRLTGLMMYSVSLKDADAATMVRSLPSLRGLTFGNTGISDAGLAGLGHLTHLRGLYLFEPKITAAGLNDLPTLTHLKRLSLGQVQVDDNFIPTLARMKGLKQIALMATKITPAGEQALRKALPSVQVIYRQTVPKANP